MADLTNNKSDPEAEPSKTSKKPGEKNYWKARITHLLIDYQDKDPAAISKEKEFRLREHDNLFWKFETHMIMHDLAFEYYWQRAFLLNFTILVMGIVISIIGILTSEELALSEGLDAAADTFEDDDGLGGNVTAIDASSRFLQSTEESVARRGASTTQVIAILGILITFLKSFEKYFSYQSRSDMHESAVTTLKDICDDLHTTRLEVDLMCDENDPRFPGIKDESGEGHPRPTEKQFKEKGEQIKMSKAKFDTMQKSCSDPIPPPIAQQFVELMEVLKLAPYDLKFFLYRRYYHKVAQRIRKSSCKVNPPFFLTGFFVDDIYAELYEDAKAFIEKWMEGDHVNNVVHAETLRESTCPLVDTQEMKNQVV